jgi:hypothetical protein
MHAKWHRQIMCKTGVLFLKKEEGTFGGLSLQIL